MQPDTPLHIHMGTSKIIGIFFMVCAFLLGANILFAKNHSFSKEIANFFATDNYASQIQILNTLLDKHGALAIQEAVHKYSPSTMKNTHIFLHHIGEYLYQTEGEKGIFDCKNYYLLGCKHGFIESLMSKKGIEGIIHLLDIVSSSSNLTPNERMQIAHGIGHGLENYYKYDLTRSLTACDELGPLLPTASPYWCYYGVFMENAMSHIYDGIPIGIRLSKDQSPLSPCKDLSKRYHFACFTNQPRLMNWLFDKNFDKVILTCNTVRESSDRTACFQGISHFIVVMENTVEKNINNIVSFCNKLPQPFNSACIVFTAQSNVWLEDYGEFPINLCQTLTKPKEKKWCGKHLVDGIIIMAPDQNTIRNFCTQLPTELFDDRCTALIQGKKVGLPLEYLDNATAFQNIGQW